MKEAFYFSHDANAQHDPKIIKMLSKFGWEGYGIYWALVERLRNEPDYILECDYDCLAFALRTDKDKIKSIVLDYNLFEVYDGKFWSKSLLSRMEKKNEKSKKARESALKRWNRSKSKTIKKIKDSPLLVGFEQKDYKNANVLRTHSETNAIKEKKVNKKKVNIDFSVFWNLYDKKVGDKSKCVKKWNNLKDEDRSKIINTLPVFLKLIPDKQFQPYPMSYLNGNRWEDDLTIHKTSEEQQIEIQENMLKRERKKQQEQFKNMEKNSASKEEITNIINSWKKR